MKNKDLLKTTFATQIKQALDGKDAEAFAKALTDYATGIEQQLVEASQQFAQTGDSNILTSRGIRQLTTPEQKFYENFIRSAKSDSPKQALTGVDATIPQTIVDTVLTDISSNHPLLDRLNIQNTYGALKWIYADDEKQLAVWGPITSAITEEMSGAVHSIDFSTNKLSAFIPVPKDLLDLAPAYLDAYTRRILADALAYGLEYGFIKGTGKNEPIGMIKDIEGAVTDGVYPDKTAAKLTSLDVKSYTGVVAKLAKKRSGKARTVPKVALIVNPIDYISKVVPATTVLATDGTYKGEIFPFPTEVFQSEMVDEGTAILGIIDNYIPCLSTGKEGKLDFSDQYQFLEDNRVYLIKVYATGRAKGSTDFIPLDISGLKPRNIEVVLNSAPTA